MRGKPFNLQGEGVFQVSRQKLLPGVGGGGGLEFYNNKDFSSCLSNSEPTSVLDPRSSPSPPTSSSSFAGSDSVGVASVQQKWEWPHTQQEESRKEDWGSELHPIPTALDQGGSGNGGAEKCGLGMEDWETMLSESGASLGGQEHSLLGWIMGEVEDPSSGLKQLLQTGNGGGGGLDFHNNGGSAFGMVDPGFGFEALGGGGGGRGGSSASMNLGNINMNPGSLAVNSSGFQANLGNGRMSNSSSSLPNCKAPFFGSNNTNPNANSSSSPNSLSVPVSLPTNVFYHQQQHQFEAADVKPQAFNSTQNQNFFVPLPAYNNQQDHQQQQQVLLSPQQGLPHQLQFLPQNRQPSMAAAATKPKVGDEVLHQQHQQQVLVDQLFKAAELVETGNLVHARGILARLNHQLSPVGKPLHRAAFLFKEALQLLLLTNNNEGISPPERNSTPLDVVLKINAYKAFSEVSPLLQFTNFTCNQALLEALESYNSIHIVDFDIGFGGQWASFMQEVRMRIGGIASLKITAFHSATTHDPLELNLTRENLSHFASELGIPFELYLVDLGSFDPASWSLDINVSGSEAVAVNLPVGGPSSHLSTLPLLLRLVKQLSPKIVVSVDRGCDRSDLPFSHYFLHSLQSCSILLDSLDAVNVNPDIVHKIEKFYLLPTIERTILGCQRSPTKMPPWKSLFTSAGFSAITFSNFTETQAEYVLKRLPVRGFHVEKRHVSLMLCWQRRELASVSAWRC
ncbi:hypothetical protein ACHQM5_011210 [Ranunculus cassubicifolius]